MNVDANISKVEDIAKIMEYGVMLTPALVINEKVVFSGQLPSTSEIKEQITKNQ
jgi:protein-disulfide isomerase